MSKFIVEGGVFTSTDFVEIEPGTEEKYGPFDDYKLAKAAWISGVFNSKIDICCHRLFIRPFEETV